MWSFMSCSQPSRLERICVDTFNKYAIGVIKELRHTYGLHTPVSDPRIQIVLQSTQKYLLENIYPFLVDLLLENVDAERMGEIPCQMLLEVFMNEDMVRFNPSFRTINPSPPTFYQDKISRMENLVTLNLNMVATDELLKVVGESCPNLQFLDIISKMGTVQTGGRSINALKLEFFVSDQGLRYLHPLKKLRRIIMRKIVGSNCGGKLVTYEGIRELIIALPQLEYVRFNNMGYVVGGTDCSNMIDGSFPNGTSHFNLRHMHDDHANPDHIAKMEMLCPKLNTLCLYVPPSQTYNYKERANACMLRLSTSKLNLNALSLRDFPCRRGFNRFIFYKGEYMKHLRLHSIAELSIKTILNIGKCCPNIITLDFKTSVLLLECPRQVYEQHQGQFFKKLETLIVMGQNTDLEALFGICVYSAPSLKILQILNYGFLRTTRSALLKLLDRNRLEYLKMFISYGFEFNLDHLTKFLVRTKTLTKVGVVMETDHCGEFLMDVKLRHNLGYGITDGSPTRTCCHCLDFT